MRCGRVVHTEVAIIHGMVVPVLVGWVRTVAATVVVALVVVVIVAVLDHKDGGRERITDLEAAVRVTLVEEVEVMM